MKWYIVNTKFLTQKNGKEYKTFEIYIHTRPSGTEWRGAYKELNIDYEKDCSFKTEVEATFAMNNSDKQLTTDRVISEDELVILIL
jgi:hypothetical protein